MTTETKPMGRTRFRQLMASAGGAEAERWQGRYEAAARGREFAMLLFRLARGQAFVDERLAELADESGLAS